MSLPAASHGATRPVTTCADPRPRALVRRVLREPLLHFCALGALVFLLHQLLKPAEPERTIRVDSQQRRELNALFAQRQGRAPTAAESSLLAERWVEDELLFRESVRLSLAQNDPELRDQLIAHMRAQLQASVSTQTPSDAELRRFFAAHRADYQLPETVSFTGYLIAPGSAAEDTARELLRRLRAGEPVALLSVAYQQSSARQLDALLGHELTDRVMKLPLGSWQLLRGRSGLHVVRVEAHTSPSSPDFDSVREQLVRDLRAAETRARLARELQRLRAGFDVQVAELSP